MKTWLFSLHRRPDNSQFISKVYNGQQWSADAPVQQTGGISNTPAAVEFNSNMYTFYERDHVFYYNTYDGEVWTGEVQVPNTGGVNGGVAAAVFNLGLPVLLEPQPEHLDVQDVRGDRIRRGDSRH
jgi:hypothetical protein